MSKSRWSQWVIAESATARIPMPWDRKTRIRHRRPHYGMAFVSTRAGIGATA